MGSVRDARTPWRSTRELHVSSPVNIENKATNCEFYGSKMPEGRIVSPPHNNHNYFLRK